LNTNLRLLFLHRYWPDYFIPLLSPENGTRIAGTSIYTYLPENFGSFDLTKIYNHKPPFSHIQSMFFVMDTDAFLYFHEISFFDEEEMIGKPMDYVIAMKEIGLSQLILAKGWSINCILPKYRGIDYRTLREPINPPGDPYLPGAYFGKSIQATDVIFYKVHRMSSSATSGFLQWIHHNWSFAILLLSFCIITFLSFLRNQCIKKSKTSLFSIRSA
jgi:hypothetical protein